MHQYKAGDKVRTLAALAVSVLAGALLVSCGGSGGGGSAPVPVPQPAPAPAPAVNGPAWLSYGGGAQHAALSALPTQDLNRIVWRTPVDMAPQYSQQGYLLVHYGSPVITAKNTVLIPVKRAVEKVFKVEARSGGSGALVWSMDTDYKVPPHNWTPSYNITLTKANRLYMPGAGGKVLYRDDADSAAAVTRTVVFYGEETYSPDKAAYDSSLFINTPITADDDGNIYFGFLVQGTALKPGLASGIARIGADGAARFATAAALTGLAPAQPATGAAPAVSRDQKTVYVLVRNGGNDGQLLALDAATLQLKTRVALIDPASKAPARISDDSTASPMIGTDGDVYMGVLETTQGQHNSRGWLLHYDATLTQVKTPGSFGWDITPSLVPASMVPGYTGSSAYLLMTKYNNYARSGSGDGKNRLAVLDPNAAQPDQFSAAAVPVMKEVLTILGPTPDPNFAAGATEWCINTAAVDPFTRSILVNSEDGLLYRWDMATNTLSQKIRLTSGLGESYTPTAVGADGTVYAINNAILFAVGR